MSKSFLFLIRLTTTFLLVPIVTWAQTLDPSSWQSNATGFATQSRTDKKTAGLGFIVEQRAWPFLYAMGGAKTASGKLGESFTGIELGQIETTGAGGLISEETDWAHNSMAFNNLNLYVSRLSAAIVVESSASSLQLLTGSVKGFQYTSSTSVNAISRISSNTAS
ncbi:MAG: hypothetical protein HYU33_03800 [Candidatus Omnitrophica bacterium]|nr:hypothetical protein [Candidatus Omnitrophota bacterium]